MRKLKGISGMNDFRFEELTVWKEGIKITIPLLDLAEGAHEKHFYKFAEQLRGATMSITNNIAEGSGSDSDKDFAWFINMSRRSVFECVNILFILEANNIIESKERSALYPALLSLSKQLNSFRKTLLC